MDDEAKVKLAQAMIEPIMRRRYGGPYDICAKCSKPLWEKDEEHTNEDCLVWKVMET